MQCAGGSLHIRASAPIDGERSSIPISTRVQVTTRVDHIAVDFGIVESDKGSRFKVQEPIRIKYNSLLASNCQLPLVVELRHLDLANRDVEGPGVEERKENLRSPLVGRL